MKLFLKIGIISLAMLALSGCGSKNGALCIAKNGDEARIEMFGAIEIDNSLYGTIKLKPKIVKDRFHYFKEAEYDEDMSIKPTQISASKSFNLIFGRVTTLAIDDHIMVDVADNTVTIGTKKYDCDSQLKSEFKNIKQ